MGMCWRYIGDTSHIRQIRNVFSEYTFKDTYIHTLILTYIEYIHVKYIYKYIFFHWLLVLLQKSIYIITMWILLIQSLKYSKKKTHAFSFGCIDFSVLHSSFSFASSLGIQRSRHKTAAAHVMDHPGCDALPCLVFIWSRCSERVLSAYYNE